jgi:signal transduction histidine kinase
MADSGEGARVATLSAWWRWLPLPLVGVSALLGWQLTPEILDPDRSRLSVGPTLLVLVLRVVAEVLHDRLRVGSPAVVAGYGLHAVVLLVAVGLNPFLCIYAFIGYVDAERFLGARLTTPAIVITGLLCAFGQAGGLPGATAAPVLFLVLAAVNVSLALTTMRMGQRREAEIEAREVAVAALAQAHEENLVLQSQLLQQAHETGIAEERARLSRELHDTVAQGLVGVIRQLENLPDDLAPPAQRLVERAEQTARDCLTETRRALQALGPRQLQDAELVEAVEHVVENWSATHGIAARVRFDGTPEPGASDDVVLRVVQEALANVARHAAADRVTVTLSWLSQELIVDVRDDGVGFDPRAVVRGHGLDGMAGRLAAARGRLVLESRPGEGTSVVAVVPR